MIFYDFSGGMESAAMLVLEQDRIRKTNAIVRWADTGKQFPEMADSIAQIESILNISIVRIKPRITFDEFLFERGGMLRQGMTDCSRRMKRSNLMRHAKQYPKPWEINLGFNADETQREYDFLRLNEKPGVTWRFPLIEQGIYRPDTVNICKQAGFTILVHMYEKMGRFDCYWCPNQRISQALKVYDHYPELAKEWIAAEERKGHSFLRLPLKVLVKQREMEEAQSLFPGCSCFGGSDSVWEDDDTDTNKCELPT